MLNEIIQDKPVNIEKSFLQQKSNLNPIMYIRFERTV